MPQIAVIHHDADFDGLASREVCQFFLERDHHEVTCVGWDYGEPTPLELLNHERFDQVFMADICIDSVMEDAELRKKLVWLDHHASAIKKWDGHPTLPKLDGIRIDGVAACRLCWQWFTNPAFRDGQLSAADFRERDVAEPEVLRLLGEWDVFDQRDPDVKLLQLGLKSMSEQDVSDFLRDEFGDFCDDPAPSGSLELGEVLENGGVIRRYVATQDALHAQQHSYTVQWEGLSFCVLNTGSPGNSFMFEGGYTDAHDALFAWRWDGKQFYCSLYHKPGREDLDLSLIAVRHGGGGHRGACGFRCTAQQMIDFGFIK